MWRFQDHVLLAGHIEDGTPESVLKDKVSVKVKRQLDWLPPIVFCVGQTIDRVAELKGLYCRDHHIALFIDDNQLYCEAVRRLSPQTMVMQVLPDPQWVVPELDPAEQV